MAVSSMRCSSDRWLLNTRVKGIKLAASSVRCCSDRWFLNVKNGGQLHEVWFLNKRVSSVADTE